MRPAAYLLVLGERRALAWVLGSRRMAFSEQRRADAQALQVGDPLFLYATRGCFHNPGRDRGRVIGTASVAGTVRRAAVPVVFGDRSYPYECRIRLHALTPPLTGVELASLVPELHLFPDPHSWSARLRRALVPLDAHDADLIDQRLTGLVQEPRHHVAAYAALAAATQR